MCRLYKAVYVYLRFVMIIHTAERPYCNPFFCLGQAFLILAHREGLHHHSTIVFPAMASDWSCVTLATQLLSQNRIFTILYFLPFEVLL